MSMPGERAENALRGAWDDLIEGLSRARNAIDSPDLHAPPVTDRGLAEGYRYLLGFTFSAIERAFFEDPAFPYFRRAIQPIDKATIDNADALYLSAAIDGTRTYRIRGRVADHRHWRDVDYAVDGPRAPQYVLFETHTAYAGDSGSLAELSPAERAITGALDTSQLIVGDDGRFEIVLAPQQPADYTGNFIATRQISDDATLTARYIIVRILFHDWENEVSPDLHIIAVGQEGAHPPPLEPTTASAQMRRAGELVENQMKFWNQLYDLVLETHGDRNGDGKTYMPRNALNPPSLANIATGGGQCTNAYSGGVYELEEGEALLVEIDVPVNPSYTGFHLSNWWGESFDYANHVTSLSGYQARSDADGITRYVIAHSDPGVPNWLDTTGEREGYITVRWTYSEVPDALPKLNVNRLPLADVQAHLPSDCPVVTKDERAEQIRIRQEHVQRRYRQY